MPTKPTIVLVMDFGAVRRTGAKSSSNSRAGDMRKLRAVELPLTSLAHDAERTRKMVEQQQGPVLLVGHSYGGAVITEGGDLPNVVGLVYIAAFAPDAGESPGGISQAKPPAAIANLVPDSDGFLWIKLDKFHESFCQDLSADEALVMAVTQKAPLASTFGDNVSVPAWRKKPSWYQVSSEDRMIDPENQKHMSGRMHARKIISRFAGDVVEGGPEAVTVNGNVFPGTRPPSATASGASYRTWHGGRYVVGFDEFWRGSHSPPEGLERGQQRRQGAGMEGLRTEAFMRLCSVRGARGLLGRRHAKGLFPARGLLRFHRGA